jgi:predicted signal transduction protein with EAL and GGDEF domain
VDAGTGSARDRVFDAAGDMLSAARQARGRGLYQLFNGELDKIVQRRQVLEDDLRTALRMGDQLNVVYQPLYSIEGTRIIGAEALARWTHSTEGLLSPDLFIGIAEERGLIGKLGSGC